MDNHVLRDKGFNRPKMTYYRIKNGSIPTKIDQILFLPKKV